MKYIVEKYHRNTPDKVLLNDLAKTAKSLGKDYISMKEYAIYGGFHSSTVYSRFGSWNAAAAKAGLKVKIIKNVTPEDMMMNLKKVWDSLGRQPKLNDMVSPVSAYGKAMYANRYGSWLEVLDEFVKFMNKGKNKIAGYKPEKILHNRIVTRTPKRQKHALKRFYREAKRKRLLKGKSINAGLRFKIFKRDNYKCRICGASPAVNPQVTLHVDHIIPRAKGGETIPDNLQTLCRNCNLGKGTHSK